MTFTPGLDGLGERLLAKKRDAAAQKAETVWQAYLRRKRCARRPDAAALQPNPYCCRQFRTGTHICICKVTPVMPPCHDAHGVMYITQRFHLLLC